MVTLQLFLGLHLYRPLWGGALVVCLGLQPPGRALALALQATGAAGLFLEDDPAALRTASHEGSCTFTVHTPGEAVRILKNEVRQRRPIAVALRQQPLAALDELVHRGVQPAFIALSRNAEQEAALLSEVYRRGAVPLAGFGLCGSASAVDLEAGVASALARQWQFGTDVAGTAAERRQRDAGLLQTAQERAVESGLVARAAAQWLRVAPSLWPRALDRTLLLPRGENG